MKVLGLLALLCITVSALPLEDNDDGRVNGENGWYIPQLDGSFEWINMDDGESLLESLEMKESRLSTNPVSFYLYTKSNPTTAQEIKATSKSISASHFNPKHPTRFTIHGWTQSYKDIAVNNGIRDAWFHHGEYNIIAVDWSRARSVDYATSVVAVPKAGEKVGDFIEYLHKSHGMSLDTLDVIGHSLGAHVAGYAGKSVSSGKVHTIVGLDPALPLFSYDKPNKRLNNDDASYVESIQTNGGKLGFLKPIGKGAFYPNGGQSQPGCGIDLTGGCAHGRSVTYYIEAVLKDDFASIQCSDYENAVKKNCGSTYSSIRMGATTNAYMVNGDYYVPVHSDSPFGMLD